MTKIADMTEAQLQAQIAKEAAIHAKLKHYTDLLNDAQDRYYAAQSLDALNDLCYKLYTPRGIRGALIASLKKAHAAHLAGEDQTPHLSRFYRVGIREIRLFLGQA